MFARVCMICINVNALITMLISGNDLIAFHFIIVITDRLTGDLGSQRSLFLALPECHRT